MKIKPYLSVFALLGVLLAACAPQLPAAAPQASETEKTLYVGPRLVNCQGVAPQKCLQVKDSPDGQYRLFYGQIEGFEFEEGKEYVLKVNEEKIENPPADSSNIQYRLLEVVSSVPSSAPPADSGSISSGGQTPGPVSPGGQSGDLAGQVWTLESYLSVNGSMVSLLPGSQVTAEFEDGQMFGNAGCNNYFASYQVEGSQIQISGAGSTEMYCSEPAGMMDQEAAYLALLSQAASYQSMGGKLQLADASGKPVLVFVSTPPASLSGVIWQMTMYNNGQEAVVSALAGTEITAVFAEDGTLSGSAGCNRYTSSYELDGESLTISPAAATRMFCSDPPGVMEQETAYLKSLETVASFELRGDSLTLRTASGAIAVEYSLSESVSLSGSTWLLSLYYVGGDAVTTPLAGATITAKFDEEGNLSGSSGCNSFTASYQVDGDSLTIGPVASTKMACPEPPGAMEQETAFLALLENTAGYQINATTLTLLDSNSAPLAEFTASPLVGVIWKWQQFQSNNDTVTAPADPSLYTLEFLPDGTLIIQADCNRAAGTYTLNGSQMDIEIGPVTLAFCPQGSLSEEYLRLLGDVVTYLFEEGDLYLDVKLDTGTMQFSQ